MSEPIRWIDDPEAPAKLRADLEVAADAPGFNYDVDGGFDRFMDQLALEPPAGEPSATEPTADAPTADAPTAGAPTAGAPTAGAPTAGGGAEASDVADATGAHQAATEAKAFAIGKGWWALAAVGVAGGALWFAGQGLGGQTTAPDPSVQLAKVAPAAALTADRAMPATRDTVAPVAPAGADNSRLREPADDASPGDQTQDPRLLAAKTDSPIPSSSGEATVVDTPAEGSLAEEISHLAKLRSVAATNPAQAVAMVQQGHARFPNGALYQEREVIAVEALARLGDSDKATERAKDFVDKYPDSPAANNVRERGGLDSAPRR